jgi:hypothetical protein
MYKQEGWSAAEGPRQRVGRVLAARQPDELKLPHRISPVLQRRLQRHGGQTPFSDESDEEEDDFGGEDASSRPEPHHHHHALALSDSDRGLVKDFEALFPHHKGEGFRLASDVHRLAPRVAVSRQVSFLTDVCFDIKLTLLKPTTTFRFLLWIDMGFVVSLGRLLEAYPTEVTTATHTASHSFIPPSLL